MFTSESICEFPNKVEYPWIMTDSALKTTVDANRLTRTFYARPIIRIFVPCFCNS